MNGYTPYSMGMGGYVADQAALQQRIQQMDQGLQQGMPQRQTALVQNVNWIQVAGLEGARNQIVQPGQTAWMMDNNSPVFYVKSVDGMGSATFKVFQFAEISPEALNPAQSQPKEERQEYVTRQEFDALLTRLGEKPENKEESV